ncbi:hypothetical protein MMC14_005582 [Varicellaria rhodocarpa]|nr:hypothetical protein [Varicellaria rhodocarpa]
MAQFLPQPEKPLKILTIDGGGLQAISTLLLLDQLLSAIAINNGVSKPRPCDIFDGIFGVGVGGWLAIFLGRFHLDITSCLSEWYTLMKIIQPRFKAAGYFFKVTQQHFYDTHQLVRHVEQLTKSYGTGKRLVDACSTPPRCRHVFVAALEDSGDLHRYNLFRTYEVPKALQQRLLPGPKEPSEFEISSAFGVTGAAKYFAPPWKEQMDNGKKRRFRDTKFPKPHKITELALNEIWGLYGDKVPISVVVNIGPGLPGGSDIRTIAKKFSWGISPKAGDVPTQSLQAARKPSAGSKETSADIASTIQKHEKDIEADIKIKLRQRYPDQELYFRFALDVSPKGAPQNDSLDPQASSEAVKIYTESFSGSSSISSVSRRFADDVTSSGRSSASLYSQDTPAQILTAA